MSKSELDPVDADNFYLFSTIRHDQEISSAPFNQSFDRPSPLLHLSYHRDRLVRAARGFGWEQAIHELEGPEGLEKVRRRCEEDAERWRKGNQVSEGDPIKIRILLSKTGKLSTEIAASEPLTELYSAHHFNPDTPNPYTPVRPVIRIHLDTEPTKASLFTTYKTTFRPHYAAARDRFGITPSNSFTTEVLLWNDEGVITDGTIRNIAVWRNGVWVTPGLETGCLDSASKRWLLENGEGKVTDGEVRKEELKNGEWVLLSNGVEGCSLGRLVGGEK
jgi:branched-subunit amino acid aminotransferase/4-amino-4-deoxychorismate lyase